MSDAFNFVTVVWAMEKLDFATWREVVNAVFATCSGILEAMN